jgi:uncharacterized protein YqjF (DUF2071 family)
MAPPTELEPVTPLPPRRVARAVIRTRMRDVCFVTWAVPPEAVRPLLPEGTRPDLFDGTAYVSLVALRLVARPLGRAPLPYLGSFPQINVRTYTVDEAGRRGVTFLSIDAARLVPALVGRAAGLPYRWSRVHVHRPGGRGDVFSVFSVFSVISVVSYTCARRDSRVTSRLVVRIGAPLASPDGLTHFLTARWGMHLAVRGGVRYVVADHERWPLREASVVELRDGLVPAALEAAGAGSASLGAPVSVVWSPGVDTRFGR